MWGLAAPSVAFPTPANAELRLHCGHVDAMLTEDLLDSLHHHLKGSSIKAVDLRRGHQTAWATQLPNVELLHSRHAFRGAQPQLQQLQVQVLWDGLQEYHGGATEGWPQQEQQGHSHGHSKPRVQVEQPAREPSVWQWLRDRPGPT